MPSMRRREVCPTVEVKLVDGQELRNEFKCPITRSLIRLPVIAADGHTYDRLAMEQWLRKHETSPITGDVLENKLLVPNHNLKRLMEDLVREGGSGLYTRRVGAPHRSASLVAEPVLLLRCLGPGDSEWNGRTFEVCREGVIGGRRRPSMGGDEDRDFMVFADSTVSRRHFEILYKGRFRLRDLGSASGTFRRLRPDATAPLKVGTVVMLGRHQLCVVAEPSSRLEGDDDPALELECFAPEGSPLQGSAFHLGPDGATLGRRATTTIPFSSQVNGELVGVDSSISAEHARVTYDVDRKTFYIADGNARGKPSTNGTWIRLPATANDGFDLVTNDELLVGSVRFHVTVTRSIVEKDGSSSPPVQSP